MCASVPGVPVSVMWCGACLEAGATAPLWVVDATIAQVCHPHAPSWDQVAEWFREGVTHKDGEYVRVDTLEITSLNCNHIRSEEECMLCFKGRIAGLVR